MCKFFSAVITKNNIFWDNYLDSHEDIIDKFKIKDKIGENINIVRIEFFPKNDNVFSDIENWIFRIDQDNVPKWFNKEKSYKEIKRIMVLYKENYIFENKKDIEIRNKRIWLKNSSAKLYNNASAELTDNASAKLYDNASAKLYNNALAKLYNNASAKLYNNASAELTDNASAELYDNSFYRKNNNIFLKNKDIIINYVD